MMRRFIERSYECSDSVKEEVNSALAEWFRGKFPSPDISLINDRESSRTFFSYTELDPDRGLYWLKTAVNAAFPEQLLMFDGNPDGSGGWRGRRQVVWLCSQFACFEEYFWICEEILYKLALCETEHDIGNNSTGVWEGLFLPVFSGSTIPFERRFSFLLEKL